MARKRKGSKRRRVLALRLAKLHLHVARQREDWQNKLVNSIFKECDVLVLERLNVVGMLRNPQLAKAPWGSSTQRARHFHAQRRSSCAWHFGSCALTAHEADIAHVRRRQLRTFDYSSVPFRTGFQVALSKSAVLGNRVGGRSASPSEAVMPSSRCRDRKTIMEVLRLSETLSYLFPLLVGQVHNQEA